MKRHLSITSAILLSAALVFTQACTKIFIIENPGTCDTETPQDPDTPDSGSGSNLVAFHASVESLNMTKATADTGCS